MTNSPVEPLRPDLAAIADWVPIGSRVIDIGCGAGDLLVFLRDQRRCDARGLELNADRVRKCVARGLPVVQGDANIDLADYANGAFDIAILSQTMQTMERPDRTLQELARIAPRVIVSTPNFAHWRIRFHLLIGGRMPLSPALPFEWYETPNIHLCTLLDFVDLVAAQGLRVCRSLMVRGDKRFERPVTAVENWRTEVAVFELARAVAVGAGGGSESP
ncbi:MAG: methionine biosynthesis protein MetW [Pseudomonadota bacterium]